MYVKDMLRNVYCQRFSNYQPYFWDEGITCDLQSHYIPLNICDLKL